MQRTEVHKFGGTSVGDAGRIMAAAQIAIDAAAFESGGTRIVVVTSAMAGVTDQLERIVDLVRGHAAEQAAEVIDAITARHTALLDELESGDFDTKDPDRDAMRQRAGEVRQQIDQIASELRDVVAGAAVLGEATGRTRDRIITTGERMAIELLSLAIHRRGGSAAPMRADRFLETDDQFGAASTIPTLTDRSICRAIEPVLESGEIAVVTGFTGRAPDGSTTTLGRGGSDLSATIIAAALRADEVTIWTDVSGVYTADPRVVPDARTISQLNYREAGEMSFYGAKVLHQRTMIPVARCNIPVRVRNSFAPNDPGTTIDGRCTPGSHPVKAISAVRGQSLISIEGKGMAGVPGVAARAFASLAERDISVVMISQSSSESSICLVVPAGDGGPGAAALKRTFRPELSRGDIEDITLTGDVGLVAAVGLGMAHVPGVAGRLFSALGEQRVNVLAIAQGSCELNVTLAVDGAQVDQAMRAIHRAFQLHLLDTGDDDAGAVDLILLGCGVVGRALIDVIGQRNAQTSSEAPLRIGAIADRSAYVFNPSGLDGASLQRVLEAKTDGASVADTTDGVAMRSASELIDAVTAYRLNCPVLIDVTDAADNAQVYIRAIERGCDVVTANKKPMADQSTDFAQIMAAAAEHNRWVRAEATVGAGLPVIDTLEMLLATGDRVHKIEGCLSGTLAFLTDALERDEPFSSAVQQAVERGYAEPDPSADLAGRDVARKAVILGRWSKLHDVADGGNGFESAATLELKGLIDRSWEGQPIDQLINNLRGLDQHMVEQTKQARSAGKVLRYVATIEPAGISVGPRLVDHDSPIGSLRGTDNMIVFHTQRYDQTPLVVTGPGAGPDVTAMGILADVLRIVGERRGTAR